jgi:hypothetical protein
MAGPVRVVLVQFGAGAELKHGFDRLFKQLLNNLGDTDFLSGGNV